MAKTDPMDGLKDAGRNLLSALGEKAMGTFSDSVGGLTDKFEDIAGGGPIGKAAAEGGKAKAEGGSAVGGALKGAVSGVKDKVTGGGGGEQRGGKATKSTNIIETHRRRRTRQGRLQPVDRVRRVPELHEEGRERRGRRREQDQLQGPDLPLAPDLGGHDQSQVPDERIVWRSKGEKGHVDGAVTFHEIGPNLTRILVVLEYYPQGLFEKTGNIWEAQGRRARAELRHFRRHVMTRTLLDPDEVEGWRGTIEDGEVVESHEDAVEREEQEQAEQDEQDESDRPGAEAEEGDYDEEEPEAEEGERRGRGVRRGGARGGGRGVRGGA